MSDRLPPGTVALDPTEVLSTEGGSVGAGGSNPELMPVEPRAEALSVFAAYQLAEQRQLDASCRCGFAEVEDTSLEACIDRLEAPEFSRACARLGFRAFAVALEPFFACHQRALENHVTCIDEQGCAESAFCQLVLNAETRACNQSTPEEAGGFVDLVVSCERAERLGIPSGCPDYPNLGAALGDNVLEGDTTGKGDDVALGCHPEIENFESADVLVAWQAPTAGTYNFAVSRSIFFSQIGILDGCGGRELACDRSPDSSFYRSAVALELSATQNVVIAIEGENVLETGYFALSISREE